MSTIDDWTAQGHHSTAGKAFHKGPSVFKKMGKTLSRITHKHSDPAGKHGDDAPTSQETARLSKLHFALSKLNSQREHLYRQIGQKLVRFFKTPHLQKHAREQLTGDIKEVDSLNQKISSIEKEIQTRP